MTANEAVVAVLKQLGMVVTDANTLSTFAFDAARNLVALRGEIGPGASNRIRDIGAIPGKSR